MTRRTYLGAAAAACAAVLASAALLAQDAPRGEMSPEQQEMMEKWQAYVMPGPHHAALARRAGTWKFAGRMWGHPDAEPTEFNGEATGEMIMGGRYLLEKVEGPFMGDILHGMGIFGYDNLIGAYSGAWVDDMSTSVLRYEGRAEGDRGTIVWEGQQPDVMTGRFVPVRTVDDMPDENTKIMTAWVRGPDGREFRQMELVYTRK